MEVVVESKRKFERRVPKDSDPKDDMTKKVKTIIESRMPEEQKKIYLKQIGAVKEEDYEGKVSFGVYAKAKKIEISRHLAMKAYPKAKIVRLATLEEWDEIFKEF